MTTTYKFSSLNCEFLSSLPAPAPSNVQTVTGTLCIKDNNLPKDTWYYPRGAGRCVKALNLDDPVIEKRMVTANEIVFAFQFPLPRESMNLDMSRWFQNLISVLHLEIDYNKEAKMGWFLLCSHFYIGTRKVFIFLHINFQSNVKMNDDIPSSKTVQKTYTQF